MWLLNLTNQRKWHGEMVSGWHVLETFIPQAEEEVASRTGETHNALISLSDAVTIRGRWRHLGGTTSHKTCFFWNYYDAQQGAGNNLWLEMCSPSFLSLKVLTTCSAGKQLWGTSFKMDGWVTRRVIKPTDDIFHWKNMKYLRSKNVSYEIAQQLKWGEKEYLFRCPSRRDAFS